MIFSSLLLSLLALILPPLLPSTLAADTKPPPKPCTIHSPSTGSYYDLRPLDLSLQQQSSPSKSKDSRTDSWHAKGYDYPANFTLNICGPVIESLEDVNGIPASRWKNVSAFYRLGSKTHSIGQMNSELVFRGRSLVLNYTGGSPCPELDEDGNPARAEDSNLRARKIIDDDDDDDHSPSRSKHPKSSSSNRRKSTLISLHCDRSPTLRLRLRGPLPLFLRRSDFIFRRARVDGPRRYIRGDHCDYASGVPGGRVCVSANCDEAERVEAVSELWGLERDSGVCEGEFAFLLCERGAREGRRGEIA